MGAAGVSVDKETRQNLILRVISEQQLGTQQDVVKALADEDVEVAQATVSRDLAELGVGAGVFLRCVGGDVKPDRACGTAESPIGRAEDPSSQAQYAPVAVTHQGVCSGDCLKGAPEVVLGGQRGASQDQCFHKSAPPQLFQSKHADARTAAKCH